MLKHHQSMLVEIMNLTGSSFEQIDELLGFCNKGRVESYVTGKQKPMGYSTRNKIWLLYKEAHLQSPIYTRWESFND